MSEIAKEQAKLQGKRKNIKVSPVKPLKGIELRYRRELNKLVKALQNEVRKEIMPVLEANRKEYQADGIYDTIINVLNRSKSKFLNIATLMTPFISSLILSIERSNRERFITNVNNAVGVDLSAALSNGELSGFINATVAKNVTSVKSIPEEFFKNIEITVINGITEGKRWESIAKELSGIKDISSVFGKLENRVKLIARNEVSNFNSALSKKRNEMLSIKMYYWQASKDERVRKNHAVMDGKLCKWNDPTVYSDDGGKTWKKRSSIGGVEKHPGQDINCRCTAIPYIVLED